MTGPRLARAAARYLGEAEHFGVTYGDGLTDADLGHELRFHLGHGRLGTMLGVQPPSQFGRLALHEDGSASFTEKPRRTDDIVNGGFFFFRRGFLDYLSPDEGCVLEQEPLRRLTAATASSGSTGTAASGRASTPCATARRCRASGRRVPAPWKA